VDLSLIVITDAGLAHPRSVEDVVREALEAGAPAIQLRDKLADSRSLYEQALSMRLLTNEFGALLFINDRLDVALAARADGVHLGPDDMPPEAARRAAPSPFLIGWSTDDPELARRAESAGIDYLGSGAIFGTTSKDVSGERIGAEGLRRVVDAVKIPVVGIGGVNEQNVSEVAATGAAGSAVISAVMASRDVARTISGLLAPFRR
jgi:thiamine-phosphate pyrophosphorylase